ncbi:hypothetical protein, partial [Oceanibaculum nanhaiense]|uniref:hypothetical protein n=1 Tax=Oceanibaculum nanhaiense TaxID=1909734 RepID=UPI00396D7A71
MPPTGCQPAYARVSACSRIETGCLVFRRGKPRLKFRLDFSSIEVCHFPLAGDGQTVDYIISIIIYEALDRSGFSGK